MPTGVENLLNYRGNAGLGSNPDIPAIAANPSLDVINKAGENAMLLSAQRNLHLFGQKVKDRDTMIKLLADGQVQSGEILPEDRKRYDEAEKKQIDAFHAIKDINDLNGLEDYQKASNDLSNLVVHAQGRRLQDTANKFEISTETNPALRKKKEAEYEEQKKKEFWDRIDPLAAVFQFNRNYTDGLSNGATVALGAPQQPTDGVIKQTGATTAPGAVGLGTGGGTQTTSRRTTRTTTGKPTTTTQTQVTSPEKPIKGIDPVSGQIVTGADGKTYEISGTKVDFNRILDNANSMVFNPEQDEHWHNVEHIDLLENQMPIYQSKPVLDTYVKKAQDYMAATGDVNNQTLKDLTGVVNLDKGEQVPNGSRPIAIIKDGQLHLNLSGAELAAIDNLAKQPGYTSFSKKWREDMDKFNLSETTEDEKIRHDKALEALNKEKNSIAWSNFNLKKDELNKVETVGHQIYTDLLGHTTGNRVDMNGLPASRQFIGGIVYDEKGKPIIGQVFPKFSIYDPKKGKVEDLSKEGLSYNDYKAAYTSSAKNFNPKETYSDYVNRVGKEKGFKVDSFYDTKYTDGKGKQIKSIADLPKTISYNGKDVNPVELFNSLNKSYTIRPDDFLRMLAQKGQIGAEFQGSNGVGNISSILETERYNQARYGKKVPLYGNDDGGGELVPDNPGE